MNLRALIVAEDNSVRSSLAKVFEREGYTVLSARDGEEGLYLLRFSFVDVVILDVHGAGRSTSEVLRDFKAINPLVPMIALVEKIKPIETEHLADALVFNPINIDKLMETANRLVGKSSGFRLDPGCDDDPA